MGKDKWDNKCREILKTIMEHPLSVEFSKPISELLDKADFENYRRICPEPMDLKTLKNDLNAKKIESKEMFCRKFKLIFENAIKFNGDKNSIITGMAKYLLKKFEKEYKSKFEKVSCSSIQIAHLYSKYLQILSEKPSAAQSEEIADVSKLGNIFTEPSLMILSEKTLLMVCR